jgi:zinc transport system permease protein
MVLPASIALQLGKSFKAVIFTGMAIGFLGMVTGLMTSYYAETPASASITLIFISFFLLVNVVQKFRK